MKTGSYVDRSQKIEVQHRLKPYKETNHFSLFPVGKLKHYNNRVSECQGESYIHSEDRYKSTQVIIAQDLAITVKEIDVQIRFKTRELVMTETGIAIPARLCNEIGVVLDMGTIAWEYQKIPCEYQVVREIQAKNLGPNDDGFEELVDAV